MRKLTILSVMILFCIGCDQSTKYTAKYFLEGERSLSYWGDTVRLSYTENKGAFLSLGADLPESIRLGMFVVLVALLLTGFIVFIFRSKEINAMTVASSALIIGGGLSNLIDRILNRGAVIDFLNIGVDSIRTGIFNVADLAIMAGAALLLIFSLVKPHPQTAD